MNQIEKLIEELCPNGVEFRTIGEVAEVGTGSSDRKDATDRGKYPFFVRSKSVVRNDSYEFDEEALIIPGEGGIGEIFHYANGKYALHQRAYRIHFVDNRVITRFAYYYFAGNFRRFISRKAVSATVTSIRKPMITEFSIPIPPLEVQRAIVDILDKFTKLEAELEAELEARKQQYEHYRANLLDGDDHAPSLSLGDIFQMSAGTHLKASEISATRSENHPFCCFGGNGRRGYVSQFNYSDDLVLIGRQGALCGNVHRSSGCIYVTEHAVVVIPKAEVDMAWAFHKLTQMDLNQYKTQSAQPGLAVGRIKELKIPFPSLDEQRRVAAILDSFDALVNSLSSGLPAEIAARRKQYEFYRDQLLSFRKVA